MTKMSLRDVFIIKEALDKKRAGQVRLQVEIFGHTLSQFHAPPELVMQKVEQEFGIADPEEPGAIAEMKTLTLWSFKHWRKVPSKEWQDYTLEQKLAMVFPIMGEYGEPKNFRVLLPITPWSKRAAQIAYDIQKGDWGLKSTMYHHFSNYDLPAEIRSRGFPTSKIFDDWDPMLTQVFGEKADDDEVFELIGLDNEPWAEMERVKANQDYFFDVGRIKPRDEPDEDEGGPF
jgi:hypothetical protein